MNGTKSGMTARGPGSPIARQQGLHSAYLTILFTYAEAEIGLLSPSNAYSPPFRPLLSFRDTFSTDFFSDRGVGDFGAGCFRWRGFALPFFADLRVQGFGFLYRFEELKALSPTP